eukprot:MONOS_7291.1-p1 / transcript=MONOS_7291.1 / gene=MONOS_7291 / organism=Monocercomonoides_exilis_PA203 / gene_product=unspecified product / transcript_product=unspecified product / location=Mono_scaffold00246:46263-49652(-) / protein_length=991 / sequence_SO=supercontig / SO=protein_coding / is_pseudo=false
MKKDNFLKDSNEILRNIELCVGEMETVPLRILTEMVDKGVGILKSASNDNEVLTFGKIFEVILNPASYSPTFRKIKEKNVPRVGNEKYKDTSFKHELYPKRKSGESEYFKSPFLHNVISGKELVRSAVDHILSTENDEIFGLLLKLLGHILRLSERNEIVTAAKQGLIDGVIDILKRCQSPLILLDALSLLLTFKNKIIHLPDFMKRRISQCVCYHELILSVLEIVIGNEERGMAYPTVQNICLNKNIRRMSNEVFIQRIFYSPKIKKSEKADYKNNVSDRKSPNSKEEEEEEEEENENCEKTSLGKDADANGDEDNDAGFKRKQNDSTITTAFSTAAETTITIATPFANFFNVFSTKTLEAAMDYYAFSHNEEEQHFPDLNVPFLPFDVRLKAAETYSLFIEDSTILCPAYPIVAVLAEGIELEDGDEEAFISAKKKEQKRVVGEKESDAESSEETEMPFSDEIYAPTTECDLTSKMTKIRDSLLALCRIYVSRSLLDIPEVLTYHYGSDANIYERLALPSHLYRKLERSLVRLINFPMARFCNLAGSCLNRLAVFMPLPEKKKTICSIGPTILNNLEKVEAEMKEIVQRKASDQSEAAEEDTMQIFYESNPTIQFEKSDPFILAMKPNAGDCLTVSELEEKWLLFEDAQLRFATDTLLGIKNTYSDLKYNWNFQFSNFHYIWDIQRYHRSSNALRLNALLSCLFSCVNSRGSASDYALIQPFFRVLVEKLKFLFPLRAPIDESKMFSTFNQPTALESVQTTVAAVVLCVLMNALKELPFAFASGIIKDFLEFGADFRYITPQLMAHVIQKIREKCIIFMLPVRINRVKQSDSIVKDETDVLFNTFPFNMLSSKKIISWKCVSLVERECCYPIHYKKCIENANDISSISEKPFFEDAEEIERKDDSGTCLLFYLDDALEESGIRDAVESCVQRENIQDFWFAPYALPKMDRLSHFSVFDYMRHNETALADPCESICSKTVKDFKTLQGE